MGGHPEGRTEVWEGAVDSSRKLIISPAEAYEQFFSFVVFLRPLRIVCPNLSPTMLSSSPLPAAGDHIYILRAIATIEGLLQAANCPRSTRNT
jgi:hypothetical protein